MQSNNGFHPEEECSTFWGLVRYIIRGLRYYYGFQYDKEKKLCDSISREDKKENGVSKDPINDADIIQGKAKLARESFRRRHQWD